MNNAADVFWDEKQATNFAYLDEMFSVLNEICYKL
jgi:hypothetical protein